MEPTLTAPNRPRPVMDIRPQQRPASFSTPAPVNPGAPVPAPAPTTPELPPDEHHEVHQTPAVFPAELPKPKAPKAAIFVALLVGSGLIGLTVFGYMKTQDKPQTATPASTPTTQAVTADEVDASITATDEALSGLDDDAAFDGDDLSDDSLGL